MNAHVEPLAADLLEDYKLKVTFATDQINRLQTQFQVMITLESAVATALIIFNSGALSQGAKWIALLEVVLSVGWLMIGRAGRLRADDNRRAVEDAGEAWGMSANLAPTYKPVGADQKPIRIALLGPAGLLAGWSVFFLFLVLR
jgi:hypothetical protein